MAKGFYDPCRAAHLNTSRAVKLHTMSEMTPMMSSSLGVSPVPMLNVDEITYRGDVPISPVAAYSI